MKTLKSLTREEEEEMRSDIEGLLSRPMSTRECINLCKEIAAREEARNTLPSTIDICTETLVDKIKHEKWPLRKARYVIRNLQRDFDL